MKDYAKVNTSLNDDFNWGEALCSVLIVPVFLILLTCLYVMLD